MSRIINVDSDRLIVERDANNVFYYSKSSLVVSIEDSRLILRVNGNVQERLDATTISAPVGDAKAKLLQVQTWIEEYVPPAPDNSIRLRSNTVSDPNTDLQLKLGTNLSVTGDTLNASGSASAGGSNTQVQYNNAGSLSGDAGMTYDSTADTLTVAGRVNTPSMQATSSAGGTIKSNSGATCMDWGAGGGQNVTFEDGVKLNASTADRILSTDNNKNITALNTTTYPSLTEISYVKGVTSAVQTQINSKGDVSGPGSANADNIVAFDGSGGKTIKQLGGSAGEILYHSGAQWTRLAAGSAGQVLQSNGAGAPTWVTPSAGQSLCKYNQFAQNLAVDNTADLIGSKTLTVVAGDTIEVLVNGCIFNNSGATRSYNIELNIGGTIMTTTGSTTIAAAATAAVYYRGVIHVYDDTVIYMNALYTPLAASANNASATATMRHSWRQVGVNRTGSQAVSASIISSSTGTQTFNGSIVINQVPSIS